MNSADAREDAPPAVRGLAALPVDHPARNRPLAQLGAQQRWIGGGAWKTVEGHWGIAGATYNQLGAAWTTHTEWRVPGAEPST